MNVNAVPDAVNSGIVYAGKCIPYNSTLADSLGAPLSDFIGSIVGVFPWIIAAMLVILAVAAIVNSFTDRATKFIKGIGIVALVAVGIWFIAMIIFVAMGNQPEIEGCPF
jgi:hypothetical protein